MTLSSHRSVVHSNSLLRALEECLASFSEQFESQGVACELEITGLSQTTWPSQEIVSLTSELLADACQALVDGGEILVTVVAEQGHIEVEVADSRQHVAADETRSFPRSRSLGVSITTLQCPQGGIARMFRFNRKADPTVVRRAA